MNSTLLKSIIVKNNDTQRKLAIALGISVSNLNAKINGTSSFRANEIGAIKTRYNLSASEIDAIFFSV